MKIVGFEAIKKAAANVRAQPEIIKKAAAMAATDVGREVYKEAARDFSQRYNLPASYVKERLYFTPAGENGVAYVSARYRHTTLARFGWQQQTVSAPRAQGDRRRGIGKGRKQAGVSVKVRRDGDRKVIRGAFVLPLRANHQRGGNGWGIFVREGSEAHAEAIMTDKVFPGRHRWHQPSGRARGMFDKTEPGIMRHLYGPSVHQMLRWWAKDKRPEIHPRLVKALQARLARERRRVR